MQMTNWWLCGFEVWIWNLLSDWWFKERLKVDRLFVVFQLMIWMEVEVLFIENKFYGDGEFQNSPSPNSRKLNVWRLLKTLKNPILFIATSTQYRAAKVSKAPKAWDLPIFLVPISSYNKEIGDEEPCYSTKSSILSFIWADLAALHKSSTI